MNNLPDRPLVVKCTFDKWHKRITFNSARNCSYDLLRRKVEQGFALSASSYAITYKDDDGEITNITTNDDLVEAIQYFQAGDDVPTSSAASILSGRSFGARKITLRVDITVDYDGPSLSDTSSLASLDEFRVRNISQQSFSIISASLEVDDDSVTVSSRDPGLSAARNTRIPIPSQKSISKQQSSQTFKTLADKATGSQRIQSTSGVQSHEAESYDIDSEILSASERFPSDPSTVFERLKLSEGLADDSSGIDVDHLAASERGAAWLRDQNERAIRSKIGALREPSESDLFSLPPDEYLDGDLALERDPSGRYYYSYTSGSASQAQGSIYDDGQQSNAEGDIEAYVGRPRPTSMHLNWLASQRIQGDPDEILSEYVPKGEDSSIFDLDVPLLLVPEDIITDCSNCGVLLDAIRYVCSICGPKPPIGTSSDRHRERDDSPTTAYSYPPDRHPLFSSPNFSSSQTIVASSSSSYDKPLPSLPSSLPSVFKCSKNQLKMPSMPPKKPNGYELCAICLETVGINHAVEAGLAMPGTSPVYSHSPFMHDDLQIASEWRRAAPKKGQMRHAYKEKAWGQNGWEDVVLDEFQVSKCATCSAVTERKRYKCVSCDKFFLCRACYSQVHELHPSHAFCIVPDKPMETPIDDSYLAATASEEPSLIHPGVKCAHCLLDIVGARFHCAICDSVDICSNCESAGLPGNLDSADGGHNSSHILIKIPYPLENTELRNASRRALHLWKGRDAAHVAFGSGRARGGSEASYAQTLIGSHGVDPRDHNTLCSGCSRLISRIRYQCGGCPSKPTAYNLCSSCESRSYLIHDPMHIFIKFPRPVHHAVEELFPILPPLYKIPSGPPANAPQSSDPRAYLGNLVHSSALCDRCMTPIEGEWFRCCYCSRDLCDACEAVDTHNDTHVFIVLKSVVDMQSFKQFANVDSHAASPPIIPYPVYR